MKLLANVPAAAPASPRQLAVLQTSIAYQRMIAQRQGHFSSLKQNAYRTFAVAARKISESKVLIISGVVDS
jgi:hypothetical protein